jgi:dephospho-CoA kinase
MNRPVAPAGPRVAIPRFCVGLTGGIGCGKSTVGDFFAARGVAVVDADIVARTLTAPGGAAMPAIAREFGPAFVAADGAMDRAAMRAWVFDAGHPDLAAQRKAHLEGVLHPLIRQETIRLANATPGPYVMLMVPLLLESGAYRADRVLAVDCPEEVQIARVMRRSNLPRAQVEAVMAQQVSRADRLRHADDVVDNGGELPALAPQIARLHDLYLELAGCS